MINKNPIFFDILSPSSSTNPFNTLISIFDSGEVFLFFVQNERNDYLFTEKKNEIMKNISSQDIPMQYGTDFLFNDIIALTSKSIDNQKCIYKFKPCKNKNLIKAKMSANKKLLMISGIVFDDIASYCVFEIQSFNVLNEIKYILKLIYVDSMLSISDLALDCEQRLVVCLPRLVSGYISVLEIPQSIPNKIQHRYISRFTLFGGHTKKMDHIEISPTYDGYYHFVTWDDEEIPEIALWLLKNDDTWENISLEFIIPSFIHHVSFNWNSKYLGLFISIEDHQLICIWEVKEKSIVQHNYVADCIGEFKSAKWNNDSFLVVGTNGILEHKIKFLRLWKNIQMETFHDIKSTRFYLNAQCELHVLNLNDLDEKMRYQDINNPEQIQFSFFKAICEGTSETVSGLHLHRCAKCRAPLLYPLVSRTEDGKYEESYCCRICQSNHWPLLLTAISKN